MNDVLAGSTILVADDDPTACALLEEVLADSGAHLVIAHTGEQAIEAIGSPALKIDVAILDVRMPEPGGLAILQRLREQGSDIAVLIVTGYSSSHIAIESTYHGAFDYLTKPLAPETVLPALRQALEQRRQQAHTRATPPARIDPRDTMIGQSEAMQQVYKLVGRIASSTTTVLITGESGTGKELVARTLHQTSARSALPFITVNCAALTETLLESELFGHEKGAFTGAMARRKGRFEQANQGTIFLDEIGDMSASMQKKLLRVLQERSFERVGGNTSISVDVRVLAATNRDLWQDVQAGHFREDLFYRLCVITLEMPPLRERMDDIPLLVEHFLTRYQQRHQCHGAQLTEAALDHLCGYHWPGNVRQLENVIERAVVLSQGGPIMPEHLLLAHEPPPSLLDMAVAELLHQGVSLESLLQMTRQAAVQAAVQQTGNHEAAAHLLAVDPHVVEELRSHA